MSYPLAREADLLVETLGDELLVFDNQRQLAHSLNPAAAKVWRACNGARSAQQIAERCELDLDAVTLALSALTDTDLLEGPPRPENDGAGGVSRRQMLRRAVLTGAGLGVAIPVIRSINAPSALAATSGGCPTTPCTGGEVCLSNHTCASACPPSGALCYDGLGTFPTSHCCFGSTCQYVSGRSFGSYFCLPSD